MDYVGTPYSFLFTPNQRRHCLNVTIIDDGNYEVRQEFFINMTTDDSMVTLSPKYRVIVLDDNDS